MAIEVKAAATYSRSQLAGLKAIGELPKVVRRILVYTGAETLKVADDIDVWPVQRLHAALAEGSLWP